MSDPAPDRLAEIRTLYDAALRGTALDGTPVTRWRYFDREDVGVLMAEVDRLRSVAEGAGGEIATLCGELTALRDAVRRHRDYRGDDRCWMDDDELYRALPEGYLRPQRRVGIELDDCKRYLECRQHPGTEYVSPQRRIEELEAEVAALKAERGAVG